MEQNKKEKCLCKESLRCQNLYAIKLPPNSRKLILKYKTKNKQQTTNNKQQTSNIKQQTTKIKHQTSNNKHQTKTKNNKQKQKKSATLESIIGLTSFDECGIQTDPTGRFVAYSASCVVVVYDLKNHSQYQILQNTNQKVISCVCFSQDGKYVAAGEVFSPLFI